MTLRSAHFEDNFKGGPKVLFWGDVEGIRDLRDFLRQIKNATNPLTLSSFCEAADGKEITLIPVSDQLASGMRIKIECLDWMLDPKTADDFAEMVDILASSGIGHQYLDCREDEVPVMVSTGEYAASLNPKWRSS